MRFLVTILLSLALTACLSNQTIGPVTFEDNINNPIKVGFEKKTLHWNKNYKGTSTDVYIKRSSNGGHLEVCGFYIESSGISEALTSEWLNQATLYVSETEIVSTSFLIPQERLENARAACVVTKTPHSSLVANGIVYLKGGKVTVFF